MIEFTIGELTNEEPREDVGRDLLHWLPVGWPNLSNPLRAAGSPVVVNCSRPLPAPRPPPHPQLQLQFPQGAPQ